jgi:hypothetical protein
MLYLSYVSESYQQNESDRSGLQQIIPFSVGNLVEVLYQSNCLFVFIRRVFLKFSVNLQLRIFFSLSL